MKNEVRLIEYNKKWLAKFNREKELLSTVLSLTTIEHIGSTAIPNISAKPYIDILIGVANKSFKENYNNILEKCGYILERSNGKDHTWLCKPSSTKREYIVHLVEYNGEQWIHRIAFRDYVKMHQDVALAYNKLKKDLAEQYPNDLNSYTHAKSIFIKQVTQKALLEQSIK